jgi:hypothetical protein
MTEKICPECNGEGVVDQGTEDERRCPICNGSGIVPDDGQGSEEVWNSHPERKDYGVDSANKRVDGPAPAGLRLRCGSIRVSSFGPRMVCTGCGHAAVDGAIDERGAAISQLTNKIIYIKQDCRSSIRRVSIRASQTASVDTCGGRGRESNRCPTRRATRRP